MKVRLIALLILIPAWIYSLGQRTSEHGPADSFHWDSKQIQELGAESALSRSKAMNAEERKELIRLISTELKSNEDSNFSSKPKMRSTVLSTRVKTVDLNGKGQRHIIAQATGSDAGCSPTGNCPIWIFETSGVSFKPILEASAIQTFTIQPTRTNGYADIVLGMHGSAFQQELHLYQFREGQYQEVACYDALWRRLVGEEWQDIDVPDIKPCSTK